MLLPAGLSAQNLPESPGRPTVMPPRRNHEFEQMQARFRKHFKVRCERLADMYNRPRLCFLRALGLDPPPPHCGLLVGQRRWSMLLIRWRELGFAMATSFGYQDAGPPAAASNREPSGWPPPLSLSESVSAPFDDASIAVGCPILPVDVDMKGGLRVLW